MAAVPGETFPKVLRLTRRSEFLRVQEKGQKLPVEPLLALYLPNGLPFTRVGLTVSTKVGNAVERARIRRHLRELFRKTRQKLPPGLDLVLIARNAAKDADHRVFTRAFQALAVKLARNVSRAPSGGGR